jgi:hypothetical protein
LPPEDNLDIGLSAKDQEYLDFIEKEKLILPTLLPKPKRSSSSHY